MPKTLVIYFSRSGNTRRVAEELAVACGGDLEPIGEERSRSGLWGYLRSAREALGHATVAIRQPLRDPAAYERVILGTPVWAGHPSSPVRSYVALQGPAFRSVAFFCTLGGSGASKVFAELEALCGMSPVATLAVTEGDVKHGLYHERIAAFAGSVLPERAAA